MSHPQNRRQSERGTIVAGDAEKMSTNGQCSFVAFKTSVPPLGLGGLCATGPREGKPHELGLYPKL